MPKPSQRNESGTLRPGLSLYLEDLDHRAVVDQTDARVLRFVKETKSISQGAKAAGVSYRSAWDRIRGMEQRLGFPVVRTKVGGSSGGGAELTVRGESLLSDFRSLRKQLYNVMEETGEWGAEGRVKSRAAKRGPTRSNAK